MFPHAKRTWVEVLRVPTTSELQPAKTPLEHGIKFTFVTTLLKGLEVYIQSEVLPFKMSDTATARLNYI